MNKDILGVIDATSNNNKIEDLIIHRSMAAIPFAGRYRLIDFVLSNMVNSGIDSVAIFPIFQYRSLMDHLGSGKEWDLNRKRDGLFFFPSPSIDAKFQYLGCFKQFANNMDYFERSTQKYALITNAHTVCNIDYKPVLKRHIEANCDITEVRHQGKSIGMYILETSLLIDLIKNHEKTGHHSILDVVRDYRTKFKICDYEYQGYFAQIDSIQSYFTHSLELLQPSVWKQLFLKDNPIYTKVKDEPPTRYLNGSSVKNSMIANGCLIEGHVENSIIFRGVKIEKNTVVKNSIIMQKSQIGSNCVLESVILDKDVKIKDGTTILGEPAKPFVIRKGTIQGALMNS